jgi:glycosyltransferase involved in cell wall biosynthesis
MTRLNGTKPQRIAVLNNAAPFLWGGAEALAENLVRELTLRGHDAELFRYPFSWRTAEAVQRSMLSSRLFQLDTADLVIPLKFPVYGIPHDRRRVWLLHQFRQVYDLAGTSLQGYPDSAEFARLKMIVRQFDDDALGSAERIFCNSHVTQKRLAESSGLVAETLFPPVNRPELYQSANYEDFFLAAGRVNAAKRQLDIVNAYLESNCTTKLIVAGAPETPEDADRLHAAVNGHPRGRNIELRLEFLSESAKFDLFGRARAVVYLPVDEDSFGYVAMEAAQSKRATITTADAGGVADFVRNGSTGIVATTCGADLSEAFTQLDDPSLASTMGIAARERLDELGLTWNATIDRLLG